jgi:hypothetical protein
MRHALIALLLTERRAGRFPSVEGSEIMPGHSLFLIGSADRPTHPLLL